MIYQPECYKNQQKGWSQSQVRHWKTGRRQTSPQSPRRGKDPGKYRRVSLTCICSKLMEHMIVSQMTGHLEDNNILVDMQRGFRGHQSCETQLVTFVQELLDMMETVSLTDAIIMDFTKAFNKVPHQCLPRKLEYYGIKGHTHRWSQAFLSQRK